MVVLEPLEAVRVDDRFTERKLTLRIWPVSNGSEVQAVSGEIIRLHLVVQPKIDEGSEFGSPSLEGVDLGGGQPRTELVLFVVYHRYLSDWDATRTYSYSASTSAGDEDDHLPF